MSSEGIAAIVVSHRSAETLDDCLQRLRAATGVDAIRVVDNASDDGTLEIVQRHALADTRLRFIANPDNPGFAVACNQGAAGSSSPWLAFVNPDCLVEADSLVRMLGHALRAGGGVIGADLVDEDGVRDAAARRRDPEFGAMLRDPSRASLGVRMDPAQDLQPVDAVSGALMLLPRSLFGRIDGFDEAYRLHVEDLDLCRRARAEGAAVAVANDVRVVHMRGVSSRKRPLFVEWHKHLGFVRYYRKFEGVHRSRLVTLLAHAAIWCRFPVAVLGALHRAHRT